MVFHAVVKDGRLRVDAPTDLPEGTEVQLRPDDDTIDDLDDEERDALNARLRHSIEQARRGEVRSAEEVLAKLAARR